MNPLLKIFCKCCGILFHICRCCYRGHVYCSLECRKAGYREIHKEAQKNYRETEKGKKQHSHAENRRRHGETKKINVKKVFVKKCKSIWMTIHKILENVKNKEPKCNFCGIIGISVYKFPKRGYGNQKI